MAGFYDLDRIEQVAVNLFYGWGYNFYRAENQLRADSLLVRSHVADILGASRRSVSDREAEFRRGLPALSREHPRPDPAAMATASALEALAQEISALQGRVATLPVPENDRVSQRLHREKPTLERLVAADRMLVGQAELLRGAVATAAVDQLLDGSVGIPELLAGLRAVIDGRAALLTA